MIIMLTVQAWRRARAESGHRAAAWLGTAALGWVCVQGAFGALTVTMKLQPAIVTMHLLGGVVLLALLTWLALREDEATPADAAGRTLRPAAIEALLVVFVQIALGGWVSSNYAVLACPDVPLCQGAVVPPMDFAHGFTGWRELGRTGAGELIPFQALVAIHWVHRIFALVVFGLLGWLAARLWKRRGLARLGQLLLGLLVLQLLTGTSNILFDWPLLGAVVHSGGAALLVALLVVINHRIAHASR
jgi:cytochrome c oxidase assembly protein subunit 15